MVVMRVGVLALHGDVAEHIAVLKKLGEKSVEVRTEDDLETVDRLIIPGGESTVMSRLLWMDGLAEAIIKRVKKGMPVYGTCAGAILLAERATGEHPPKTLGLMDIIVDRNAYGTQIDSFETALKIDGISKPVPVAFIRAPVIARTGKDVEILAMHENKPVLVRQGKMLAGTFHPEVRGETAVHRMFLAL